MGATSSRCVLGRGWNKAEIRSDKKIHKLNEWLFFHFSIFPLSHIQPSIQLFKNSSAHRLFGHYSKTLWINTILMPTTSSSSSSSPVVSTPNRRNTNPPSYSDVEKEKTHKVGCIYLLVSNAENSNRPFSLLLLQRSPKREAKDGKKNSQLDRQSLYLLPQKLGNE